MDSKKLPLEEEKERYEEFLKELEAIGIKYSLPNERTIIILRDSISKFLDRFVSEKERDTFKSKMRTFTIIAGHETEMEKYQRHVQDYVSVFNSMKEYLQSSIKAMEYALKTDYLREKSDADRREIVLDRKTKGSSIETVEGLREENKRLRKQLSEAESKEHQTEVKN